MHPIKIYPAAKERKEDSRKKKGMKRKRTWVCERPTA
jgi:hypothetical protein